MMKGDSSTSQYIWPLGYSKHLIMWNELQSKVTDLQFFEFPLLPEIAQAPKD